VSVSGEGIRRLPACRLGSRRVGTVFTPYAAMQFNAQRYRQETEDIVTPVANRTLQQYQRLKLYDIHDDLQSIAYGKL